MLVTLYRRSPIYIQGVADDFVDDMYHAGVHLTETNRVFPLIRDHCRKQKQNKTTKHTQDKDEIKIATTIVPLQEDGSGVSPPDHRKKRTARSSFDGISMLNAGRKAGGNGGGTADPQVLADLIAKKVYQMMKGDHN